MPGPTGITFHAFDGSCVDATSVVRVTETRRGRGALEGLGIGALIGIGIGAVIGLSSGDDDCDDDHHNSCFLEFCAT